MLIALILITELVLTVIFPNKCGAQIQKKIDLDVHGKKIHRLYAFELMIQFLVEDVFFNMHSDILLNLTPGVLIV